MCEEYARSYKVRARALDFKVEGHIILYTIGGGATTVGADEPRNFEKYSF